MHRTVSPPATVSWWEQSFIPKLDHANTNNRVLGDESPSLIELPCAQHGCSIQQNTVQDPSRFHYVRLAPAINSLVLCFDLLLSRCPAATALECYLMIASVRGNGSFAECWSSPAWSANVVGMLLCVCVMKMWKCAVSSLLLWPSYHDFLAAEASSSHQLSAEWMYFLMVQIM